METEKPKPFKLQTGFAPAFLEKLYDLLEDKSGYSDYISWQPDGKSFLIKKVTELSEIVLPKYFKHNNLQSFIRQLNMYCFSKTRHDSNFREFTHQLFQKGRRDLLPLIKRKVQRSIQAEDFKGEPLSRMNSEEPTELFDYSSPQLSHRIRNLEERLERTERKCRRLETRDRHMKTLFKAFLQRERDEHQGACLETALVSLLKECDSEEDKEGESEGEGEGEEGAVAALSSLSSLIEPVSSNIETDKKRRFSLPSPVPSSSSPSPSSSPPGSDLIRIVSHDPALSSLCPSLSSLFSEAISTRERGVNEKDFLPSPSTHSPSFSPLPSDNHFPSHPTFHSLSPSIHWPAYPPFPSPSPTPVSYFYRSYSDPHPSSESPKNGESSSNPSSLTKSLFRNTSGQPLSSQQSIGRY